MNNLTSIFFLNKLRFKSQINVKRRKGFHYYILHLLQEQIHGCYQKKMNA